MLDVFLFVCSLVCLLMSALLVIVVCLVCLLLFVFLLRVFGGCLFNVCGLLLFDVTLKNLNPNQ